MQTVDVFQNGIAPLVNSCSIVWIELLFHSNNAIIIIRNVLFAHHTRLNRRHRNGTSNGVSTTIKQCNNQSATNIIPDTRKLTCFSSPIGLNVLEVHGTFCADCPCHYCKGTSNRVSEKVQQQTNSPLSVEWCETARVQKVIFLFWSEISESVSQRLIRCKNTLANAMHIYQGCRWHIHVNKWNKMMARRWAFPLPQRIEQQGHKEPTTQSKKANNTTRSSWQTNNASNNKKTFTVFIR